jgi:hypothetical protein
MPVLAFLASALYWPGIAGAATVPRWALLAFVVPWVLREQRMSAAHVAGGVFLAWAAMTMVWNPAPLDGIGALLTLLTLACCFLLGNQLTNLRGVIIGAGLGLTVSSAVSVAQYLGFHPVGTYGLVSGLFVNGNYMAEAAALIVVGAVAERIWWLIPGLLPALFLPDARGAVVATALSLMVHFRYVKGIWWLYGLMSVCLGLYIAAKGYGSIGERLTIWQETLDGVTIFGQGIGSYWSFFPAYEYAHNEFLHVAFETGIVGLVLFCTFCVTLAGPMDTARLVLIALFVESCFASPIHWPTTGFISMVAAGHAVWSRYLLRNGIDRVRSFGQAGLANG